MSGELVPPVLRGAEVRFHTLSHTHCGLHPHCVWGRLGVESADAVVGYLNDVPLENTKIWLGPGERAPVPLHTLEARLSGQVVTGLREIVTEVDTWVSKLESASEDDNVGMKDVDTVHTAFLNAETDSLWESAEHVAALVKHMPARFRVSYFNVEDGDRQKFWMKALATATGRMTRADLVKEREKRSASKA